MSKSIWLPWYCRMVHRKTIHLLFTTTDSNHFHASCQGIYTPCLGNKIRYKEDENLERLRVPSWRLGLLRNHNLATVHLPPLHTIKKVVQKHASRSLCMSLLCVGLNLQMKYSVATRASSGLHCWSLQFLQSAGQSPCSFALYRTTSQNNIVQWFNTRINKNRVGNHLLLCNTKYQDPI